MYVHLTQALYLHQYLLDVSLKIETAPDVSCNHPSPRGIAFDDNGNLIVTAAGNGGGEIDVQVGLTDEIVIVDTEGTAKDSASGFPSYASVQGTLGLYRAYPYVYRKWTFSVPFSDYPLLVARLAARLFA